MSARGTSRKPHVLIVDSGMRTRGGHNFSYTRAVQRALEARGAAVDVFVNRGLASDMAEAHGFHPIFSCGAYDHPLGHGRVRDLVYLRAQSVVYTEELFHGLRCVLKREPDLVFCHTLADFELLGWRRYVSSHGLAGCLALLLRQTPRWTTAGWLRRTLNPYWRLKPKALADIRARLREKFLLCTDSVPLSEDYARVYSGRIATLPIPLDPSLFEPASAAGTAVSARYGFAERDALRVGYLGDARASKGFPLLPDLVRRVDAPAARFVIQCPRPASGDDHATLPAGLAELQALASQPGTRLTLVPEKLTNEDYADFFQHLDVVLLPYVHDSYREATSGIFAEALALGKPVVVPSGTWMASELGDSGAGAIFARDDAEELAARVRDVVARHADYAAAAQRRSGPWRVFHSADTLARMLLAETSLDRPLVD